MLTLDQVVPGTTVVVETVGGTRSFRRRLMELGLIPGIKVELLRIAPFGDPMELSVRGCNLSIRAAEAHQVGVERLSATTALNPRERPQEPSRSEPNRSESNRSESNRSESCCSASSRPAPSRSAASPSWEATRQPAVRGLAKSAP